MKDVAEKRTASKEARRKELHILTRNDRDRLARGVLTFGYIYVKAKCKHVVMLFNIRDRG